MKRSRGRNSLSYLRRLEGRGEVSIRQMAEDEEEES